MKRPAHWVQSSAGLREQGPEALAALLEEAEHEGRLGPELDPLIDRVAAQRYARTSRLYWYTELDQALARAKREHKPILSLRLLGDLREDLSCANSRYFRVVLYTDPAIAKLLRERFILHWSAERPVPKITVDYGDGRKLVRTITGNSIHYALDHQGRVLDAIPGLYAPAEFALALEQVSALAAHGGATAPEPAAVLREYHEQSAERVLRVWARELRAAGLTIAPRAWLNSAGRPITSGSVSAAAAIPVAASKALPELPLAVPVFAPEDVVTRSDSEIWARLGRAYRSKVTLSKESRALMRELAPSGFDGGRPIPLDEQSFLALVDAFEQSLAVDTQRNRLELRWKIHERLAQGPLEAFDDLNRWVYSALFLTPRSDPWLGLVAQGAFTGLPGDGIAESGRDGAR